LAIRYPLKLIGHFAVPPIRFVPMSSAACPVPAQKPPASLAKEEVFSLLAPHLAELDRFLRAQLAAFEPEIRPMADYCLDASGKRLRPALVFLSGWQGGGAVPAEQVRAAAVVELVHLATLVHDDIMDEAELRRGRRTAAREHGPNAAVLLGDALFAHALNLASQFPTPEVCAAVSESTRRVCAGEIVQTLRRGSAGVTRADYRRIIELKTAELFRVSCFLGAQLAKRPQDQVEAIARFGRHLGVAYQIYDDLADFFGEEKRMGKTLGTDLMSGKVTLPLLVLLERLPVAERAALQDEILARRDPQMSLRLTQMDEWGVFPAVAGEIEAELSAAAAAFSNGMDGLPSPRLLLSLAGVLRAQVAALRH
jgi:octaprenyl-diphosphate synthase